MDEEGAPRAWRPSPRAAALTATGASVVAVLAALAIPHWLSAQVTSGPTVPRPPTPTHAPEAPGTRTWQALTCASRPEDGCAVPASIDHAGLLLHSAGGARLVWHDTPGAADAVVELGVPPSRGERWVLVGGRFTGAHSRISVQIGRAAPVTVPPDRLSLFVLRGHGRTVVQVADVGRPRDEELLRIEEYAPR